jgi:hypothetical protein
MDVKTLEAATHARNALGQQLKLMEETLAQARKSFHDSQFSRLRQQLDRLTDISEEAKKVLLDEAMARIKQLDEDFVRRHGGGCTAMEAAHRFPQDLDDDLGGAAHTLERLGWPNYAAVVRRAKEKIGNLNWLSPPPMPHDAPVPPAPRCLCYGRGCNDCEPRGG